MWYRFAFLIKKLYFNLRYLFQIEMCAMNTHDSGYLTVLHLKSAFRPTYENRMLMIFFFFLEVSAGESHRTVSIDSL